MNRNHVHTLLRLCGSLLIVAGITLAYYRVFTNVNSTTIALTFLLAILGIATRWGLVEATVAAVSAMLCFNFFFLPPVGKLTIADPQNWVALFAFLVTAVVASQLSASARKRALEATARRQEMERLYELSRSLMLVDKSSPIAGQVSHRTAQVFDLPGVAIFDRRSDRVYRTGSTDRLITDIQLRNAAMESVPFHDASADLWVLPLNLGGEAVGSLAIGGSAISATAMNAIGTLAAITLLRAHAEEEANRLEAARQNEAMKSMLLDALAHEFKTPLTSIKAAASSILDEERPAQQELVTVIEEETDRLDSLVTETIRMARIEAGDLQLHPTEENVKRLIDSALEKLKILLEDREINIELASGLPDVLVDVDLAGLALRQLITNALKYADPDSAIRIRACTENHRVKISVKDSGPGIPDEERTHIFERYYRVAESADRVPGTGIGLTIARDIVRAHGGEMWVESALGQGSEFFFTLPALTSALDHKSEGRS
jgi:two-component system, OmpR family, sensor histidine kinase KdpD